jgi:hypothetical protein
MTRTLILFLAMTLAACATPIKLGDTDLREHITGSWLYKENDPPLNFSMWLIFEKDGSGTFGNGGGGDVSEGKGRWTISGNVVHIKVESDDALVAMDSDFEILSMTSRQLKLRETADGRTYVFTRKKL